MKKLCGKLDKHIRFRLRMCIWKHWKTPRTGKRTLSSSDCHGVRHMVFRMQRDMPECAGAGISTLESVKRDWLSLGLYLWKTTTPKGGLLVKLIEPPCTERYARWCERSKFLRKQKFLLLDWESFYMLPAYIILHMANPQPCEDGQGPEEFFPSGPRS